MKSFALGFAAGIGATILVNVSRVRYVRKRQKWHESQLPTAVPARYRVRTEGDAPTGSATIRTYQVRPRKRPE